MSLFLQESPGLNQIKYYNQHRFNIIYCTVQKTGKLGVITAYLIESLQLIIHIEKYFKDLHT